MLFIINLLKLSCLPGTCTTSKSLKTCTYELLQISEVSDDLRGFFSQTNTNWQNDKQKNLNGTDAVNDSHTEHQEKFLERLSVSISSN